MKEGNSHQPNELPSSEIRARESYLRDVIGIPPKNIKFIKENKIDLYPIGLIEDKVGSMVEDGFVDPRDMIRRFTTILNYRMDNIEDKIVGLGYKSFINPQQMIESSPVILGFSFGNIDDKIAGLSKRYFANPTVMIESSPVILNYGFDTIDDKIDWMSGFINEFSLDWNVLETLESNLTLFGTAKGKLNIISSIIREYQPSTIEIKNKFGQLYRTNLECLLVSYCERQPLDTIDELVKKAARIQRKKVPMEDKRQVIVDYFESSQESSEIYREYKKEYLDKKVV